MNSPATARGPASRTAAPLVPFLNGADPEVSIVVERQQRMAEALAAAGQKWLEGLQEIATRSLVLQGALLQQGLMSALSVMQAANPVTAGDAKRSATQAMEATAASLREVIAAACRCPAQTLAAFRDRMQADQTAETSCRTPPSAKARS